MNFRWSSRGGCYNEGDFFFELREREDGRAEWRGLRCQYGQMIARLIAKDNAGVEAQGNYQASGTMSRVELQEFIQTLEAAGVWTLGPEFSGTGSQQSLHFRVGDRLHEVPAYQSSYDNEATPGSRVNSVLCQGLPGRVSKALYRRVDPKHPPDGPLLVPGQEVDWEAWRAGASADQLPANSEVVPWKDLWPADGASLFLLVWGSA